MKLKGVKKLDRVITEMVNAYIDNDIDCYFSTNFCIVDNRLYYSLFIDEECDNDWKKWLRDTYGSKYSDDFSTFVLSILHEIGHYHTLSRIDDEVYEADAAHKLDLIIDYEKDSDEEQTAKRRAYWELEVEKRATDWAINFYNRNKKKMKNFYTDCMAFIGDFYRKNITEDEED